MTMTLKQLIVVFSLCVLFSDHLSAGVVPSAGSESVPKLFSKASLVFKGEVESVTEPLGSQANSNGYLLRQFLATIRVDRLYKGEVPGGLVVVSYARPGGKSCDVSPCQSLTKGEYELFFVSSDDSGYHLLDTFFGKFRVSRQNASQSVRGLEGLESDLVSGLRETDEIRRLKNIELLGAMGRLTSNAPLLNRLLSGDTLTKAAIYVALLHLRDYSSLAAAGELMASSSDDPRVQELQSRMYVYISQIRDPDTVPILLKIASSHSDAAREAAISALRGIESADAVPTFVFALDDPISLIRYDAVVGLATVEHKWELAPSVETFQRNESKYISAWKQWWQDSGKVQYSH